MAIIVDPIFTWPKTFGHTRWSHMGSDDPTDTGIEELHRLAGGIGMKRSWFQDKWDNKHYDLVPTKRALAVKAGAIEVSHREYIKRVSWPQRLKVALEKKYKITQQIDVAIHESKFSGETERSATILSNLEEMLDRVNRVIDMIQTEELEEA